MSRWVVGGDDGTETLGWALVFAVRAWCGRGGVVGIIGQCSAGDASRRTKVRARA